MIKKTYFAILMAVTVIILGTVAFIQPVTQQSFYHFRLVDMINEGKINKIDNLAYSERGFYLNPYHFMTALISRGIGLLFAARFSLFIFGIASIALFYFILKQLKIGPKTRLATCLITAVSPAFIFTFGFPNPQSLAVLLSLLGFYFFLKEKRIYSPPSFICFALASLFSIFNALLIFIGLLIYTISKENKRQAFLFSSFILLIISSFYHNQFFYRYGFDAIGLIRNISSDLGGIIGFSIFSLVLAIFGIAALWKNKKKYYPAYLTALFLLLLYVLIGKEINPYSLFVISFFAGAGFIKLIKLKWNLDLIKKLTIITIICGLAFSTISYINRAGEEKPSEAQLESLEWLEANSQQSQNILSHHSKGYLIQYTANRTAIIDDIALYDRTAKQIVEDSQTIFYSRDLKLTKELLTRNNIDYVWISPGMKEGKVWKKENEGLLFLFSNNETFKNVYNKDGIEIWEYLK